jgi:iron complex transport system substrate-binding protein
VAVATPAPALIARLSCLVACLVALSGCDQASDKAKETREARAEERSESPVARVVSLSPSTTEAMHAVGAGALLVGRSSFCDHPAEVTGLPSVGGYADPNVEAILALEPTLVIGEQGPAGPALERRLHGHHIATFFPRSDSSEDVAALLVELGKRFDRKAQAEKVAGAMRARIERIRRWAAEKESPRVVVLFELSPLYVAGPGSFPDQLIRLAHAENVVSEGGKWPTIDVERLLTLDADVIVDARVMDPGSEARPLAEAPGFAQLRAVGEGRVRKLESDAALRPGPRLGEGLAALAKAIHDAEPPR